MAKDHSYQKMNEALLPLLKGLYAWDSQPESVDALLADVRALSS